MLALACHNIAEREKKKALQEIPQPMIWILPRSAGSGGEFMAQRASILPVPVHLVRADCPVSLPKANASSTFLENVSMATRNRSRAAIMGCGAMALHGVIGHPTNAVDEVRYLDNSIGDMRGYARSSKRRASEILQRLRGIVRLCIRHCNLGTGIRKECNCRSIASTTALLHSSGPTARARIRTSFTPLLFQVDANMSTGPFVRHVVSVNAPASVVWDKLVQKVRRPDLFVPGVTNVEVVRDISELSIERKMTVEGGKVVHELISADPLTKTIVFKHHEGDDMYRGVVINTLFEEGSEVFLDYTMNWYFKNGTGPQNQEAMQETITKAVTRTKEVAEEAAKQL
jgi:hypothetical protein